VLAQIHRPAAGDTVLALGGRECYVVGVLAGADLKLDGEKIHLG